MTGAARGIGLATAKRFLADDRKVALLDIDGDNLARTYQALAKPDVTIAIASDVADPAGVVRAIDIVAQKFGRLNALVNNTGIAIFKPILDATYEDWQRVLAVNLTGPFLVTQANVPADARQRRWRHCQHHLNLRPARIDPTHCFRHQQGGLSAPHQTAKDYHDRVPFNRYGLEEELAEVVYFLCSERASYITGQILAIDGGFDSTGIGLPTVRAQMRTS